MNGNVYGSTELHLSILNVTSQMIKSSQMYLLFLYNIYRIQILYQTQNPSMTT